MEKWRKSRHKSRNGGDEKCVNSSVCFSIGGQEGEINGSEGDGSIGVTLMAAELH